MATRVELPYWAGRMEFAELEVDVLDEVGGVPDAISAVSGVGAV